MMRSTALDYKKNSSERDNRQPYTGPIVAGARYESPRGGWHIGL